MLGLFLITIAWSMGNPAKVIDNALQELTAVKYHIVVINNKQYQADAFLFDRKMQQELILLSKDTSLPINTVVLELSSLRNQDGLDQTIRSLHGNRIKVLLGLPTTDLALVQDLIDFNAKSENDFDGIVFTISAQDESADLTFLQQTKLKIAQAKQPLIIAGIIPLNHVQKPSAALVFNYLNLVVSPVDSLDYAEITKKSLPLLAYASETQTPVYLQLSLPTTLSVIALKNYTTAALQTLAQEKNFSGFYLNSLTEYQQLNKIKTPTENGTAFKVPRYIPAQLSVTANSPAIMIGLAQDDKQFYLTATIPEGTAAAISLIDNPRYNSMKRPQLTVPVHVGENKYSLAKETLFVDIKKYNYLDLQITTASANYTQLLRL
jgi:hypothetical protein